jgi:hypothetical protein
MKPLNVIKRAIHTEKGAFRLVVCSSLTLGVFDSVPLLTGLPVPREPIIITADAATDSQATLQETPKSVGRSRAATVSNKAKPPPFMWQDDQASKYEAGVCYLFASGRMEMATHQSQSSPPLLI